MEAWPATIWNGSKFLSGSSGKSFNLKMSEEKIAKSARKLYPPINHAIPLSELSGSASFYLCSFISVWDSFLTSYSSTPSTTEVCFIIAKSWLIEKVFVIYSDILYVISGTWSSSSSDEKTAMSRISSSSSSLSLWKISSGQISPRAYDVLVFKVGKSGIFNRP